MTSSELSTLQSADTWKEDSMVVLSKLCASYWACASLSRRRSCCRFKEVDDPHLFPPPPPPKQPPPPPPRTGDGSREDVDAEKRAFEAEIDRVIEEVSHFALLYT